MEISLASTLVLLTWLTVISGAPTGSGSIYARDTDKISGLRNKLQRLHDLLARLDTDGDLSSFISNRANKSSSISFEDMKGELHNPVPMATTTTTVAPGSHSDLLNSKQDEDSILVLSKALARLQQPFDDRRDSTGDYLGTEYNEENSKTEDTEKVIAEALERLNRDKSRLPSTKEKNGKPEAADSLRIGQNDQLKEEAMKTVVQKLIQDIELIQRFGFSLDDVIRNVLREIARQKELSDMENELESLAKEKYI